ncbi:hypothetical protein Tco_0614126, partial [Tanacetum coccineum]
RWYRGDEGGGDGDRGDSGVAMAVAVSGWW